ncbi:MAG: Smr/MutS family protein [Deltaproteobacteria bacterium]|nr:Smr/MutS family protein [Deltaproteobacteria bacterium]
MTTARTLPNVDARTLAELDFPRVQAAVAARAQTDGGKARCTALPLLPDSTAVAAQLAATAELMAVAREDEEWPVLGGVVDVTAAVRLAERGGVLEPRQLLDVAASLGAGERVSNWCVARRERAPTVAGRLEAFGDYSGLVRTLDRSIERTGRVADSASPELGELRRRAAGLRETLGVRMEQMVREFDAQGLLQDTFHTLREDRYVLPVKAHERWRVQGIVHDTSQTHQTYFIEPQEVVDLGNRLKAAQADVAQEEHRILQHLSTLVGARAREIAIDVESLHALDVVCAGARLGVDLGGRVPALSAPDGGGGRAMVLRGFRHPLLALDALAAGDASTVVANDLLVGEPRVLVITGPNTGGKTVALKGAGLSAVMVRAGLPLPVEDGSTLPLYDRVHAVVGDGQSLQEGLSSFAAHLQAIRDMLHGVRRAAAEHHGCLCVLDEIMAGTDPDQGAALGQAVLEELARLGADVVATTHFEKLKAPGLDPAQRAVFRNAAVGLASGTLRPTYRLTYDTPGSSSALDMAAMLGLPGPIVERARELSSEQGRRLEELLRALGAQREALDEERATVARAHEAGVAARQKAEEERESLRLRARELRTEVRRGLLDDSARLRAELEEAVAEARTTIRDAVRAGDATRLEAAQAPLRNVAALQQKLTHEAEVERRRQAKERAYDAPLQVGSRVHVLTLDVEGEVLELTARDALVAAGALRLRVALGDLAPPRPAGPPPAAGAVPPRPRARPDDPHPRLLDLRGTRVDDALERLAAFLDHAVPDASGPLTVLHGHGTGALRTAIREVLARHPAVQSHRKGNDREGGNGVTVVTLKDS